MQDGSVSPIKAFFRNKWVRLILVIDAIIIISIAIFLIINATKQSTITFNVVPANSQISLNGKSGYSNGTYRLTPGIYDVEISHEGLDTKNFEIDLEKNDSATIITFLHQGDNFDFYTLRDNIGDYFGLAEIASAGYNQTTDQDISAGEFIAQFQKNYIFYSNDLPIIDKTPTEYGLKYGVHYQYDTLMIQDGKNIEECVKTLCLYITDTSGDKEDFALSVIRRFGIDPDDFQIVYRKVNYE